MNGQAILVFRIGSLGDTMVSLPAFRRIRSVHPDARIVLLTNVPVNGGVKAAASYSLLMGSGLIDEFMEYPIGEASPSVLWALIRKIRGIGASTGYYLMPAARSGRRSLRDYLFFKLAGVSKLIGLKFAVDASTHLFDASSGRYESEGARLLRMIGMSASHLTWADFALGLTDAERAEAAETLRRNRSICPYIAVSVGSKVTAKEWGQDNWITLLKTLGEKCEAFGLVLIGSNDEKARCDDLAAYWKGPTLNLCGQMSPRASAALLESASVFIGHDSGPMHLANSAGIPAVSIFAARELPGVWFPVGNEQNVFYKSVPCSPCRLDDCVEMKKICIRSITPEAVQARVLAILEPLRVMTQSN